jgi:hypothetical protein
LPLKVQFLLKTKNSIPGFKNNIAENFNVIGFFFNSAKSKKFDSVLVCKKSDLTAFINPLEIKRYNKGFPFTGFQIILNNGEEVCIPFCKFGEDFIFYIKSDFFFTNELINTMNSNETDERFHISTKMAFDSSITPEFLKLSSVKNPIFFFHFLRFHSHFKNSGLELSTYDIYFKTIL